VTVEVTAPGFGKWTINGAPVRAGKNRLQLYVQLMPNDYTNNYVPPEERPPRDPNPAASENAVGDGAAVASSCSGYSSNHWPPPKIRVWRRLAGAAGVTVYNFKFYVKHSLRAGAEAVKNYAWYYVNNGSGWRAGVPPSGECYDVDDSTLYQGFDPDVSDPATDQAVNFAWSWLAKKSGVVFEGRHLQTLTGDLNEPCGAGANGAVMSQYGTQRCALDGLTWKQIVTTYYYPNAEFQFIKTDFSGDGCADVLYRKTDGTLHNYRGNCANGFIGTGQIGTGWGSPVNWVFGDGDFSGDGCPDVLYRKTDGTLHLYRGDCANGFIGTSQIGSGWGSPVDWIIGPGDFSGDGCADVIYRKTDGTLHNYRGNCSGGFIGTSQIGTGFDSPVNWIIGPGDFNGDGCADIIYRKTDGTLHTYRGNCANGFIGTIQIGTGWGSPVNWILGPGDFSGDGCIDIVYRKTDGTLHNYRGNCANGFIGTSQIGSGWGSPIDWILRED
jgi:hypothetical protein